MPVFGNESIKEEWDDAVNGYLNGTKYDLSEEGIIQSISLYLYTAAGNIRLAIYTDDAGAPGSLLCVTASTAASTGWNNLNTLTNPTLAAGTYWLVYQTDHADSHIGTEMGAANQLCWKSYAYAEYPETWEPDEYAAWQETINATYTIPTVGGYTTIF